MKREAGSMLGAILVGYGNEWFGQKRPKKKM